MDKYTVAFVTMLGLVAVLLAGCVERKLTIITEPEGARVSLNDEQIGESPVTVTFNWYGDYYVRATKEGYETLQTHRELDAPWYDWFPLDFFAQVLYPGHIVDSQEWTFELAPSQPPTRDELLQEADALRQQVQ